MGSECSENSSNSSIPSSLSPPYDSACCYQQQGSNFLNPSMSVQRYHSQFIKEGLKKKERTTLLIAEGEALEIQNSSFKEELIRLEAEKRRLNDILTQHEPTCVKRPRLEKVKDSSKNQKDVFKVPNAPMPKESHQTPSKVSAQKVEHFDTQRKNPTYSGNTNAETRGEPAFSNEFQYFNYNEGFDQQRENNMFAKQQAEHQNNQQQQQQQAQGYYHYSFYGANLKNNLLDSQPLSLSNYGFNGVDNMCVAL